MPVLLDWHLSVKNVKMCGRRLTNFPIQDVLRSFMPIRLTMAAVLFVPNHR